MKHKLFSFVFAYLITYSIALAQTDEQMIGKWGFHDLQNKEQLDSFGLVMMNKIFSTLYFVIKEDYTYKSGMIGTVDYGEWFLSSDSTTLNLRSNKGENVQKEIISVDDSSLILRDKKASMIFKKSSIEEADREVEIFEPTETVAANLEQITKLWKVSKKVNPEFSEKQQILSNSLVKGFLYRFDEDGTFYSKALNIENETEWEFGEENKSIIIKGENFDIVWKIHSISENELVMSKGDSKDIWYFSPMISE